MDGVAVGVAALGVVDHLADEQAAAFGERDRDGIADLRLVRRELELWAGFYFPRGDGRGGLGGQKTR